jgi:hypothetical protein
MGGILRYSRLKSLKKQKKDTKKAPLGAFYKTRQLKGEF